ncbi:MAG: hypothetical protein AAGJ80_05940, partial [Cyanobacteria bacterium J06553_1]
AITLPISSSLLLLNAVLDSGMLALFSIEALRYAQHALLAHTAMAYKGLLLVHLIVLLLVSLSLLLVNLL